MLVFENKLSVDVVNSEVIRKIEEYWESKTFIFTEVSKNKLVATRGSIFKNNFTFNMMKLKSDLTITIEDNEITTLLVVDPICQIITNAEKRYWPMELDSFKEYIVNNRLMEEELNQYYSDTSKTVRRILIGTFLVVGLLSVLVLAIYL